MQHRKFDYTDEVLFLKDNDSLCVKLPYSRDTEVLNSPLDRDGVQLKNRILIQPIEGFDALPDGAPSERSAQRYLEFVRGGASALWIESISVNHEGRSNPYQLWITPENVDCFKSFTERLHQCGGNGAPVYLVAQLTHSGRNSNPDGVPKPVCAFSNPFIPKDTERIITDAEIAALEDDYVSAIVLAERAGFDAVDIRACHGYLINELFAAFERDGEYGGSFDNRTRMLLDIVDKAHRASALPIAVRLNMYDGVPYPYGWGCDKSDVTKTDFSEPLELVRQLSLRGVKLLNISSGIGAYSPHVIRPYDSGGAIPKEHPLEGVARLLDAARQAKSVAPDSIVVCSGLTWLREFAPCVSAGGINAGWFDVAGFGRQA
ncbi:MAG: flavin oxidoreductase/NADH oxidase, partial [Oscillospiraceae bacterium]